MLYLILVCFSIPAFASFRYDAAHSSLLAAKTSGTIQIAANEADEAASRIREQLFYFVGPLNGYGAGADIVNAKITLLQVERNQVKYSAEFLVAWPKGSSLPQKFRSVLPLSTDDAGKKRFYAAYGTYCVSGEEPADSGSFFYYYRPEHQGCRILQTYDPSIAVGSSLDLKPALQQTSGKSPEYDQIWSDGRFVATLLVGTYADGTTSPTDQGVQNYDEVYRTLRQYFGNPSYINVPIGPQASPGLRYPDIEMVFQPDGVRTVNLNLLLIQKYDLQHPSEKFLKRYQQRTEISDFVAYNGHSGLGSNIRALSKLGHFVEGQYQIFFVNGCDTFSYVDSSLANAHAAVNPGSAASKYFDLITNAMPSPFQGFAQNALAMHRAIWEGRATYRDLLAGFSGTQRPIVSGEEDNNFPQPF